MISTQADACPFCDDLKKRLKMGAEPAGVAAPRLYCKDVAFGGFAPTTKMLRAFAAVEEACGKKGDKMIIFGGNKASLDLIEAALIHEPEFEAIGCFRYDGDISQECRNRALRRFKAAPRGAVLLTTVQTSGVGLNITEANHVLFLDRWFNPTTHDQAMDRTHRYGQKKPVEVTFLDCEDSVDKVMRIIDEYKSQNAKVATANEGDLPGLAAKKVSWKMLCGVVKDTFKEIFDARAEKMGITRLLATTYDNAGAGDGGGPVPFNYDAAVGDPWAPLARRAVPVDWKPAKREPKAEARAAAPAVIDLRGDSDVEMMVAAPALSREPIPIAIDSDDGAPWTCARCTYAENRPCFLCCEMCGGERGA